MKLDEAGLDALDEGVGQPVVAAQLPPVRAVAERPQVAAQARCHGVIGGETRQHQHGAATTDAPFRREGVE